jgi:hypothetical protein
MFPDPVPFNNIAALCERRRLHELPERTDAFETYDSLVVLCITDLHAQLWRADEVEPIYSPIFDRPIGQNHT